MDLKAWTAMVLTLIAWNKTDNKDETGNLWAGIQYWIEQVKLDVGNIKKAHTNIKSIMSTVSNSPLDGKTPYAVVKAKNRISDLFYFNALLLWKSLGDLASTLLKPHAKTGKGSFDNMHDYANSVRKTQFDKLGKLYSKKVWDGTDNGLPAVIDEEE
tara:strand:+ start:97 stop:567 length:471 start_codon:yes stop_codon:yes gene_type:complete